MQVKISLMRTRSKKKFCFYKEHSAIRFFERSAANHSLGLIADKSSLSDFCVLHDLVDCRVAQIIYSSHSLQLWWAWLARASRKDPAFAAGFDGQAIEECKLSLNSKTDWHKCLKYFLGQSYVGLIMGLSFLSVVTPAQALKIDRVILSTNNSHDYIQFWPLIAKVWKDKMGIQPTLALIGDDDVQVDTTLGDVVRFKPIPGVPTWFYAQIVRLLFPAYYPNDICMLSDIDMLPLNRNYFEQSVFFITDPESLIIFRDKSAPDRYPMCYIAAQGRTFKELFNLESLDQIPNRVTEWFKLGLDWYTDETILYRAITNWSKYQTHVAKLGYGDEQETDRICRSKWQYDLDTLHSGGYVDAHLPRPYCKHIAEIEQLVRDAGLIDGEVKL